MPSEEGTMKVEYGDNTEIELEAVQGDFAAVAAMIVPLPAGLEPSRHFRAALRRRLLHNHDLELLPAPDLWPLEAA